MKIKQLSLAAAVSALTFTTVTNAVLGPIPIYLNTEYRTNSPVINPISSTLKFNSNDIKLTGSNTVLEFLSTIPSIGLVAPQGNTPAIFMRGGKSDHTLVLIDGINANDISSSNGAVGNRLSTIAIDDIEKIEIIKGSGSILYGSGAIAGVVNIITKKSANGSNTTVSLKYGTHNSKTYKLLTSSGDQDGFVRFSHNKYSTNGINARTDDTTNDKDGVNNQTTQIKIGNKSFKISYLKSQDKSKYDNCSVKPLYTRHDDCSSDDNLSQLSINTNKRFSDTWKTYVLVSQTENSRKQYLNGGTLDPDTGDLYKGINITILNDININDALVNIGLSKTNDENFTTKQKLSSKEAFVNWQKNINNLDINTGARYIKHDEYGVHTIYNLGISKNLDNNIKLTSSVNTTFKSPTLFQIDKNIKNSNTSNPSIKPETSKNIEIGIEKKYDWGVAKVAAYKNKVENFISVNDAGTPGWSASDTAVDYYYNNNTHLNTKGIELSLSANLNDYDIIFTHNYNDSKMSGQETQELRRPKNITNLQVSKLYRKLASRAQIIRKSSSLDVGTVLDSYTLVNLGSSYQFNKDIDLSLFIKNAANKNYTTVDKYSQLGRTIELGVEYKF